MHLGNGTTRITGYVEATRGCKHTCRHCPIVPVYNGRFRVVQKEVVLADIRQQVEMGAQHITFGDPDFLNGPGHVLPIVNALHREFPKVTYDVTIKIEHLLKYQKHLPRLRDTGCLLVTSAVEAVDDRILSIFDKGHTRSDFIRAVRLLDEVGLALNPTFVAFNPWITLEGYRDLLQTV
ncbi:MAG: radical SAM protein, partial [Anaerolineales bacterium]|nr:radical SAM protein [Anaerolineales bacterium]